MNSVYNKHYYENYDVGVETVDYSNSKYTKDFLEAVANKIADDLQPRTVLDAGCAMGHLVAALRDRGIEAYGIDISEYAVTHAREDIRPFCFQGSLAEPLPEGLPDKFDLVVSIEVLEHLYAEDGKKAIQNLCQLTDTIIFSSTPDDFVDPTHLNVQQREYWAVQFAENGFLDDLSYRPKYLTHHAACYRRRDNILRQIQDYERNLHLTEDNYRHENNEWNAVVKAHQDQLARVNAEIVQKDAEREQLIQVHAAELAQKQQEIAQKDAEREQLEQVHVAELAQKQAEMEQLHRNAIEELEQKRAEELGRLTAEWDQKAATLQQEHESQLASAEQRLLEQESELKEIIKQQRNQAICQIKNLQRYHDEQVDTLMDEHKTALDKATAELKQLQKHCDELQLELDEANEECQTVKERRDYLQLHYITSMNQRNALEVQKNDYMNQLADISARYQEILDCTCWKMTKPIRVVGTATKNALKRNSVTRLLYKGCSSLVHEGPGVAWKRVKAYVKKEQPVNTYVLTKEEIEEQRKTKFPKNIKFSILVPLYNTPERFLREMIQSVKEQTYGNWELCLVDGSDKAHKDVKQICLEYRAADKRIKYRKLQRNLGISGNTNACIEMARGDYIALFDHDDLLHPAALFENMKAICEKDADFIYTDENTFHETPADAFCPHFKPDFAPDTLRANNYICHLTTFKKSLLNEAGLFRKECDGSQDFDMVLRLTEKAKCIVHIPKILYYWRAHKNSVAEDVSAKPYVIDAAHKAISDHLERVGLKGQVLDSVVPSMYRLKYEIVGQPLVSILIPNKDHIDDLQRCLDSIFSKTTYSNYEIIIIENNSELQETFDYYQTLRDSRVRIVNWKGKFNYSAINNFGFRESRGEHVLLLNNDTEIISPDWIQEMLMYSQRKDVGAVGAKLYYPDHTIQHAGIGIGLLTLAGHYHRHFDGNHPGYMGRLIYAQDLSAVTGACVMMRRDVYEQIHGLDETFEVAFNDVDMCMRIRQAGYLIVWTPFAELYHYESKSRGLDDAPDKRERFVGEVQRFQKRWKKELEAGDPYYNPNFSLDKEDFTVASLGN